MGAKSHIEWTDATWNPWHGCRKVSDGCKFCYMFRDKERYGQKPTNVIQSSTQFNNPLKWQESKIIFTCSWSDFFIEDADEWRESAWKIIKSTPRHTYQILTKRPDRIKECLPEDWGDGYPNVWIGVSVESQKHVERIEILNTIPCSVSFISFEPLLSKIKWDFPMSLVDWVIIGGESGNETGKYRYRPMELSWLTELIEGATKDDVACFVKQMGTQLSKELKLKSRHGSVSEEWPEHLQIQQFPTPKLL